MNLKIIKHGIFSLQVCVPKGETIDAIEAEANTQCPAGTTNGWLVRTEEECKIRKHAQRVQCAENPNFEHLVLDC